MKSNYAFLNDHFPALAGMGSLAEDYLYTDGNSCLIKLGLFGETMVNLMMALDGVTPPEGENTHANRIKTLKLEGLIPAAIDDIFYALRKARNRTVHEGYDGFDDAKALIDQMKP